MKKIGIVICNYNKKEYVLKCIETVLASDIRDFDVFVVDNASQDGSAEAILKQFGKQVTLLCNTENLGGSGGFNTGIQRVLEGEYQYLMCLDNDVQVTADAVRRLYEFLEEHKEVGMVGSKVYHLQKPDYVQQMGLMIHFDTFCAETLYADVPDSPELPEVLYCHTVAACSLMMPVEVVRKVGMMPEDNFIYWDDMEWGYLVGQAGYKVACCGASKVYHEMSANVRRENTFSTYYLWRNQLHFFMKYTPREDWERMSFYLIRSLFDAVYESMYREEHNVASTLLSAFFDAMTGKRGKAEKGRILENDKNDRKLEQFFDGVDRVYLEDEAGIGLAEIVLQLKPEIRLVEPENAQKKIRSCQYIMDVKDAILEYAYMDPYGNVLEDPADAEVVKNYAYSLQLFLYTHQNYFLMQVEKLWEERTL